MSDLPEADDFIEGKTVESLEVLEMEIDEAPLEVVRDAPNPPSSSHDLFENSIFPVVRINRDFKICYANPGSRKLFSAVKNIYETNFLDIFRQFFEGNAIRQITDTVTKGKAGYSWKGVVRIKSREIITTQAKVYIFPAEMSAKEPREFIVMFDDVTEENRQLILSVFMSLLKASRLKDNDTGQHITRVNFYSRILAGALHLCPGYERVDADFIDDIGLLASMHDVGKIGTPDDILNKVGPLLDWEWQVMKEHTKNGAFILATYPNPMAHEIAMFHHEKWNGTGYPFQLEGDMIPLSARIVSIADVYDALRMRRGYKAPFDHPTAVAAMKAGRGAQFDPAILDIFFSISDRFNELFENNKDL